MAVVATGGLILKYLSLPYLVMMGFPKSGKHIIQQYSLQYSSVLNVIVLCMLLKVLTFAFACKTPFLRVCRE